MATASVASRLTGYAPEETPPRHYALQAKLGDWDADAIELVGDSLQDLRRACKRNPVFDAWAEEWTRGREKG